MDRHRHGGHHPHDPQPLSGGSTIDAQAALDFLRESDVREDALAAAERLAEAGATVVASGWRDLEGILILGEPATPRTAVVAATGERALRDLLLRGVPRGERVRLHLGHAWQRATAAELVDGEAADAVVEGVKRGWAGPGAPEDPLLGRADPAVALLRDLAQPAGRERHGRFVAEGPTLAGRAIESGQPVDALVYRADLPRSAEGAALLGAARAAGIRRWRASDGLLGTLTPTRPLPDALASVHLRPRDAVELTPATARTILVAEGVQNPDNLGMVLRTADAAGAGAVVAAGARPAPDPLHRNCVRAARGAVGRIPIFRCADLPAWVREMRRRGATVLGATGGGETSLFAADMTPPVVLIVGSEDAGITPETLAACTARVAIPMAPGQDSLNVGVAAGVALFELVRRRG